MLHYTTSGSGKETLVLLHGFLENSLIWRDLEPFLSKEFSIVKIDLPGHGNSPRIAEVQTMELMAAEVKKVIEHLGISQFHLLGHSMGGYISLAFTEKYPSLVKTMTLFFSSFLADTDEKKEQRKKSYRVIQDAFPHYVNAGVVNYFNANELDLLRKKIDFAKEVALSTDPLGALACAKGMVERPNRKTVLENFNGKILVIAGNHDNAVNTEKTIKNLPDRTNIKSYILDCGHDGHLERPSICAEIINTELLHELPKNFVL